MHFHLSYAAQRMSSNNLALNRLRKEYRALEAKPLENIRAAPLESNILEWHYVIEGTRGTPYEGGWYHGIVVFPPSYPMKPPSIQMYTPNGRFKVNTRLCLSMSDFHPETWNPMWSVGTILMGLYSFMLEDSATYGSMQTSNGYKKKAATESLQFNCANKIFVSLFPELVEINTKQDEIERLGKCHTLISNRIENDNNRSDGNNFSLNDDKDLKEKGNTFIMAISLLVLIIGICVSVLTHIFY